MENSKSNLRNSLEKDDDPINHSFKNEMDDDQRKESAEFHERVHNARSFSQAEMEYNRSINEGFEPQKSGWVKLLVVMCIIVLPTYLYFFDGGKEAVNSIYDEVAGEIAHEFGDEFGSADAAELAPGEIPVVPIAPPKPPLPNTEPIAEVNTDNNTVPALSEDYVEYLDQMEEAGLLGEYEGFERRAFYGASVPVSFLVNMRDNGYLDEFEFFEIISFFNSDVPISYLDDLKAANLLDEFEFHEIVAFRNNDIPTSYLTGMQDAGFLDRFEFFEIVNMYTSGVSVDFLKDLNDRGILDKLDYYEISEMAKDQ